MRRLFLIIACSIINVGLGVAHGMERDSVLSGVWVLPQQSELSKDSPLKLPQTVPPPLNAKTRAIYDASEERRLEAESAGQPLINDRTMCLPDGVPFMMSTTFPLEILETRNKVTIIAEFNTQVRHIYLDEVEHPSVDELEYTFYGHSIGRWEGSDFIVDTIGLRDSTVLFERVPHSEGLRVVERFRLIAPDVLAVSITMIDPVYLTKPWTITRIFERRNDVRLNEFICAENNRHYGGQDGTIDSYVPSR